MKPETIEALKKAVNEDVFNQVMDAEKRALELYDGNQNEVDIFNPKRDILQHEIAQKSQLLATHELGSVEHKAIIKEMQTIKSLIYKA